jgi:hypothetical protein
MIKYGSRLLPRIGTQSDKIPYIGFTLQGKNAMETKNWAAEGLNLRSSFKWYETAIQAKDLKP